MFTAAGERGERLNESLLQTEIKGDVSIVLCGSLPRDRGLMWCGATTKFRGRFHIVGERCLLSAKDLWILAR